MKANVIQDLLFLPNSEITYIARYIHDISLKFISAVFIINLVIEYFREWKFHLVLRQTLIALIAIYSFTTIHQKGVEYSFEGSSQLINKYSKNNHFIKNWTAATNTFGRNYKEKKEGVWEKLVHKVKTITSDIVAFGIWSICVFFFMLLKQLYSFVYHFTLAFAPLCAVLSIFPISRNSLAGAIKSSMWCMLVPFLVATMLIVVGNAIEFRSGNEEYLVSNLEGLIQLGVSIVLILWTMVLAQKIIDGTGMSNVAAQIGQMATMAAMMKPHNFGMNKGLGIVKGAPVWGMGRAGEFLSQKANNIRSNRGLVPNAEQVLKSGVKLKDDKVLAFNTDNYKETNPKSVTSPQLEKQKSQAVTSKNQSGHTDNKAESIAQKSDQKLNERPNPPLINKPSLKPHEKAVLMADNLINYPRNKKAKIDRFEHVQKLPLNSPTHLKNIQMPLGAYTKMQKTPSFQEKVLGIRPEKAPFKRFPENLPVLEEKNLNYRKDSFRPSQGKSMRKKNPLKEDSKKIVQPISPKENPRTRK